MSAVTSTPSSPINRDALRADIDAAVGDAAPASSAARLAILSRLKVVVKDARKDCEQFLLDRGSGYACAERLSAFQDALIQAITDFAVERIYVVENPTDSERMAISAVGGYGRGTLAPGSDIDLLFVLPYKQTPWGESVVEYVLYILWDLGFKVGHATRTVDETLRRARGDMTIRTALLETRMIWGTAALFEDLESRFDNEVVSGTAREFVEAKLAERDARIAKAGGSRYLVEPNIKEGKGGLRDLNTLFWIAKYVYQVRNRNLLVKNGVFSRSEYRQFKKAEDFLWSVRCHLHFLTNRPEERLSFDVQREIAHRLGYTNRSGMMSVERFMKHYFLTAKSVGDLTGIICAELEENEVKSRPSLNRFMAGFPSVGLRRRKTLKSTDDFVLDKGRLIHTHEDVFKNDPVNLIRMFHIASDTNCPIHPDCAAKARRQLKLLTASVRDDKEANRLFLAILCNKANNDVILRRMNETGVLGKFVPDFGKVVAMMQFNMYHHYTVDEHLIRTIGALASIDRGTSADELPLASKLIPTLRDKSVLYVALFLHDIAKGRPEDHSIAGAKIARKLCPRLGLSEQQTETVVWLVEEHLTMSMIAQSRDLADRRTIVDFAAVVQSLERMKLLLILTVCDIRGVGPGVWNGWKGQLLRTLYYETEPYLTGGHSLSSREHRVEAAKQELAETLVDWRASEKENYLNKHYPAYWIRVDLETKRLHAEFIRSFDASLKHVATDVIPHSFEAVTELTVYAIDHPRLLSVIAGTCAAASANIVDAQVYTTADGYALDTITISREFQDDHDEVRRARRITDLIEKVLKGEEKLPELVAKHDVRERKNKLKAFSLKPDVNVTNDLSDRFTVIEVSGLDRPGLLFDLTRGLNDLNLDISSAHVATFGERAVDVFYVTDLIGEKITLKGRRGRIERRLLEALDDHPDDTTSKRRAPRQAAE